jgi:hypothetical protein
MERGFLTNPWNEGSFEAETLREVRTVAGFTAEVDMGPAGKREMFPHKRP